MRRPDEFFHSAEWYDSGINWAARLERELPVFREVFGPPGELGLLDAGCGTGRQAAALARLGYRMTGLDADEAMLELARAHASQAGVCVDYRVGTYDVLPDRAAGPYDGVLCVGNALAACASAEGAREAVRNFAEVLAPGGRLFVQILNFPPMRHESPCVRGPRVVVHDGIEYVSTRTFSFAAGLASVTNVTLYKDDRWRFHASGGLLYPISPAEMNAWCAESGLRIDRRLGAYDGTPLEPDGSVDLIIAATKR